MTAALTMRGVRYRYPDTTDYVLDGIDIVVQPGEWGRVRRVVKYHRQ